MVGGTVPVTVHFTYYPLRTQNEKAVINITAFIGLDPSLIRIG